MIWKGLAVLIGAAGVVALGVVALALVTVPDEPSFAETLDEAVTADDFADFEPTAIGALLEITGAREATVTLDRTVQGPTYGIGDSKTRVFFESDPLAVDQMSHDGLAFFPEPGDCEFTEGEHNEELGLVAVTMSCPELVDIRDNGTIAVEGQLALPSDLVIELDLPDMGGVLAVGDDEWDIVDPALIIGATFDFPGGGAGEMGLPLNPNEPEKGMFLSYDLESGRLSPGTLLYDGTVNELEDAACSIRDETIMVINPQAEVNELTLDCTDVDIEGLGPIDITGTIVYQKLYAPEG